MLTQTSFSGVENLQYYLMRGFSTRSFQYYFPTVGRRLISSREDAEHYTVVLSRLHNCSKSLLQVSPKMIFPFPFLSLSFPLAFLFFLFEVCSDSVPIALLPL